MAVVEGDIVAVHHTQDTNCWYQYQPPRFGVVPAAAHGDVDVLWEDGLLTENITEYTSLDVILDPSVGSQSLEGKVVRLSINPDTNLEPSGSYDAVVIRRFRRQTAGVGNGSANRVLVQLLSNGAFMEVWQSQVTRLDDR